MSEALKELKTIYDIGLVELPQERLNGFIRRINIIEKELKEHETLKTLHANQIETINALLEEDKTKDKKLKALEVIKERLDIGIVILGDEPKLRITFQNMLRFYDITQEEFELLKEVLL